MPNFIKKTIVIQSVKVADILQQWDCKNTDLPHWVLSAIEQDDPVLYRDGPSLMVQTATGENTAPGDGWIIQGVDGELYPCPSHVFEASYLPHDDEAASLYANLLPHEQRVMIEIEDLGKKVSALEDFILNSAHFSSLSDVERGDMSRQLGVMLLYDDALKSRASRFSIPQMFA